MLENTHPHYTKLNTVRFYNKPDACYSYGAKAYEESAPTPEDGKRLGNSLAAGGIAVLACVAATGEPVGAGVCSVLGNQTTEIAGIGVRVAFRRRGIAAALTTRLVREAFDAGVTVAFLMAAHQEEMRIYICAGFSTIGEILHISLSPK
ncbi:MAG: GNAT family N-acetyltransferase [Nostoc sp.]|uniref:GNAT family N-acetyltransferase n=1 Tax=Nostoc sp. TaxID=1180 RepID=UPI002FFC548D